MRDARGRRHACFSIARMRVGGFWSLEQVAGKANAEPSEEIQRIAQEVLLLTPIGLRAGGGSFKN